MICAAVRDGQQVPRRPIDLVVAQQDVRTDGDTVTRARRSRKPHNSRRIFRTELLRLPTGQVARGAGRDLLDHHDVARATRRLGVLHTGEPPPVLQRIRWV